MVWWLDREVERLRDKDPSREVKVTRWIKRSNGRHGNPQLYPCCPSVAQGVLVKLFTKPAPKPVQSINHDVVSLCVCHPCPPPPLSGGNKIPTT